MEKRVKEGSCLGAPQGPTLDSQLSIHAQVLCPLPCPPPTEPRTTNSLSPPQKESPTSAKLRHIGMEIFKWSQSAVLSPVHTAPEEDKREELANRKDSAFSAGLPDRPRQLWAQGPERTEVTRARGHSSLAP